MMRHVPERAARHRGCWDARGRVANVRTSSCSAARSAPVLLFLGRYRAAAAGLMGCASRNSAVLTGPNSERPGAREGGERGLMKSGGPTGKADPPRYPTTFHRQLTTFKREYEQP